MSRSMTKRKWNWFKNEEDSQPSLLRSAMTPWQSAIPAFSRFQRDFEQVYSNALRSFNWPLMGAMPHVQNLLHSTFQPNVDIASNDNEYMITMEVPGLDERDIKVDINNEGMLTVSGEKRHEMENQNKDFEYSERSYGIFQRSLTLPEDVDQQDIEAHFRNGVLTIICPRNEEMAQRTQRKQIPVNEGHREGMRGEPHRGERGERGMPPEAHRGAPPEGRNAEGPRAGAPVNPKKAA